MWSKLGYYFKTVKFNQRKTYKPLGFFVSFFKNKVLQELAPQTCVIQLRAEIKIKIKNCTAN